MKIQKNHTTDNYDILSAIWILACNDENPQLSYEGIIYRLGLNPDFDLKSLVLSRSELFRKRTNIQNLEDWKSDMLNGKKRIPSYISDLPTEKERLNKINSLKIGDVFRSQFRPDYNSERSKVEIINWGLEHINRLRKAELELNQERSRKVTSIIIPSLTTFIAVIAVISSFYVQYTSNKNSLLLKKHEIEFSTKQNGYSFLMGQLVETQSTIDSVNYEFTAKKMDKIESAFYSIEPFLSNSNRELIWHKMQNYSLYCRSFSKNKDTLKKINFIDTLDSYKYFFRTKLYNELFN